MLLASGSQVCGPGLRKTTKDCACKLWNHQNARPHYNENLPEPILYYSVLEKLEL